MCCLKNEEAVYEELNRTLPGNGDLVATPDNLRGVVQSVNILRQLVKVVVDLPNDEKEIREYPASELRLKARKRARRQEDEKALRELAELENRDKKEKSELDD